MLLQLPWQTENQPLTPFENFHFVFVVPIDYRNKSHEVKFFVKSKTNYFSLILQRFKYCQHIESFEKRKPKLSFAFSDMMKMKKE